MNVVFVYKRVDTSGRLLEKQVALGLFLENTRFFNNKLP
ncbi:hypothetical protein D088_890050 [Salmonella enterica subsp. houtenae serovar 16:z4,z32:-- str. RKS3027]|nr:hypothetical protein D088_890050 [Salmonella enterica subsp. houtenae serovar 16:z4,z32:-- str. RKS3027]